MRFLLVSVHISTQEQLSLSLHQAGGLKSLELKGALNLLIASRDVAKVKLTLNPLSSFADSFDAKSLQFKHHPNLARTPGVQGLESEIKLKDANRSWPVGTPLEVLRWKAVSKDESLVPLSRVSIFCSRCSGLARRMGANPHRS